MATTITGKQIRDSTITVDDISSSAQEQFAKTKVSSGDTTTDYLSDKIVAGPNIIVNIVNTGSYETLAISASLSSAAVTALNNAATNRLVTIGSPTSELDGTGDLTFDGSIFSITASMLVDGNMVIQSVTGAFLGDLTGTASEASQVSSTLSDGTGITTFSFNGASPATVAIDESIVVTLTGSQTLSNKIVSGSFSGSYVGDGSGLTGVTAEWDGTHVGDAQITGTLYVTEAVEAPSFTGSFLGDVVGTASFATEAGQVSNELTDGTGITDFTFDGSAPATVSIDESIVVTLTGSQTLTNKIITGSFSGSFFGDGSGLTGISSSAAGSSTEVQFNTGGILDASPSLTFDGTILKVTSSIEAASITASFLGDLAGTASEASKVSNALVDGTGITNFSFDGSSAATVSIDESIVVTLTGSQTLTNKIITGSFSGSFVGDGSGLTNITASAAGSTNEIQFNTGGILDASPSLVFSGSVLKVTSSIETTSITGSLLGNVIGTASFATEADKVSNALVDGTGITNFSFDGSAPATVSIDETIVVTLTGSQTLSNKVVSGSFSGSFVGDGSGLTGVTAEWDGTHVGDAQITGTLYVTEGVVAQSVTASFLGDLVGTSSEASKVTNALVDGTGITDFTFDGSAPATVSIDESIVVTLTGSQTLSNKVVSGSFSGSFVGDGSGLTGVTAEWDGTHVGDAQITGTLYVTEAVVAQSFTGSLLGDVIGTASFATEAGKVSNALTDGTGITNFSYDGSAPASVSIDETIVVTLTGSQTLTNKIITGSFSGSFVGDGSGLTGITASAAGDPTEIQFNTGGILDASPSLTFGGSTLSITGSLIVTGSYPAAEITGGISVSGSTYVDEVSFDLFHEVDGHVPGRLSWNAVDATLDLQLTGSDVVLQVGQEEHLYARNASSADISNGEAVRILGSTGTQVTIEKAISVITDLAAPDEENQIAGVATEDIAINERGYVTTYGLVRGINTVGSGSVGDILYLSNTVSGAYTSIRPVAPYEVIEVGILVRSNASVGEIFVQPREPVLFSDITSFSTASIPSGVSSYFCYNDTTGITNLTNQITASLLGDVTGDLTGSVLGNVVGTASFATEAGKVSNALVDGTGITNFSFDGSAPATVSIDETIVVTLTGSQTLTNKTITGSFSGSFFGDGSGLTGITASIANPLTSGHGIETFSYDGSTAETVTLASGSISVVDTTGKSTFYSTLSGALAAAVSGEEVEIGPGEYLENDLLVPPGVSVRGYGGWSVTRVGTTSSASNIMTLSDDSYIDNLSFNIPTGSGLAALVYTGSAGKTAGAYNITLFGDGGTGSGDGIVVEHSGSGNSKLIGAEIRCDLGGLDSAIIVRSGIVALESIHVPGSTGTINKVVSAVGTGRTQLVGFNVGNPNVVDAMYMSGSSTNNVFNANFFNCQNGFHFAQDGVDFDLIGGKIEVAALTALVDPAVSFTTASSISFDGVFEPTFSFPASAVNADFSLTFNQKNSETRLAASRLLGAQLSVGFPEKGSNSIFGQGQDYGDGTSCFSTDATADPTGSDGGNFIDISSESQSLTGSTFAFQTASAGSTILICSQRKNVNDEVLKHYGYKLKTATGDISGSYAVDIWNGSEWEETFCQAISVQETKRYANKILLRSGQDEFIQLGEQTTNSGSWALKTINSVEGYWSRIRIVSTGSSAPATFEYIQLTPNYTLFNDIGQRRSAGLGMWRNTILGTGNIFGESGGVVSSNISVGTGGTPTGWSHNMKNNQLNQSGDAIYAQFTIPPGTCTAYPLKATLVYSFDNSATLSSPPTGTMSILPIEVVGNFVADPAGGTDLVRRTYANTETLTSKEATAIVKDLIPEGVTLPASGLDEKIYSTEFNSYDISSYYDDDIIAIRFELTDDGSANQNVIVWAVEIEGVAFSDGKILGQNNT